MAEPDPIATPSLGGVLRRAAVPLIVLLVVAGIGSAALTQGSRLDDFEWRFTPGWLVLGVAALLVYQAMLFGVWIVLVRGLGAKAGLRREAAIWNTSLLARYVPTSALMTVVRVGMYERAGVGRRVTLAASVYELLLQLVVAVVVGAWWMLQMPQLEDHASRWLLLVVPLLGFAALHPRVLGAGVRILLRRFGREGEPVILPTGRVLVAAGLYAACFVLAGVGVLGVARSLHPVAGGDVPLVLATFAIAFVVSVLAFILPGGLGARETGLATALSPALPFGVGLAVAVLVRLLQLAIEIAFAAATRLLARTGREPDTPVEPEREPAPASLAEARPVERREPAGARSG